MSNGQGSGLETPHEGGKGRRARYPSAAPNDAPHQPDQCALRDENEKDEIRVRRPSPA
jgi:hypothetical protein